MKVGLRFVTYHFLFCFDHVMDINARLELIDETQQCSTDSRSGHHVANEVKNIPTIEKYVYLSN